MLQKQFCVPTFISYFVPTAKPNSTRRNEIQVFKVTLKFVLATCRFLRVVGSMVQSGSSTQLNQRISGSEPDERAMG